MPCARWMVLVAIVLAAGCAGRQAPPIDDSLYQALGQKPGITRVVEGMLLHIAKDERIKQHFAKIDIVRLRDKLVEQFCAEAGGPCVYSGDSMAESHKHMNLTRGDFNALVENLIDSMDDEHIAVPVQNRLLARLAPMRGNVIER